MLERSVGHVLTPCCTVRCQNAHLRSTALDHSTALRLTLDMPPFVTGRSCHLSLPSCTLPLSLYSVVASRFFSMFLLLAVARARLLARSRLSLRVRSNAHLDHDELWLLFVRDRRMC